MASMTLIASAQQRTKIPKNIDSKVKIIISGKSRTYCPLYTNNPAQINLKGPAKIRIITRPRFKVGEVDQIDYTINYRINGGKLNSKKFNNVERTKYAVYQNGKLGIPGKKNEFFIEVGRGNHNIEFYKGNENPKVAARYRVTKKQLEKQSWVALAPDYPNEPVNLVTKENINHYYRFSQKQPLKFNVIGPTEVRILTRAEIDYKMEGRINYRIQVKESGQILNTFFLGTVKSHVTTYLKNSKLIPGKAQEIVINVPYGRHKYEVFPLDQDKQTLLGKLLFPKIDVTLEE